MNTTDTLWASSALVAASLICASDDTFAKGKAPLATTPDRRVRQHTSAQQGRSTITVTAPNGGEVWQAGTEQYITWDTTESDGVVELTLLRNGLLHDYIGSIFMNSGSFPWTVCDRVGDAADYTIRIVSLDCEPPIEDSSDGPFTIAGSAPTPTLTVTSPNGGEVWPAGAARTVTWSSTNPHGYVGAWLVDGEQRAAHIGYASMENGVLEWNINKFLDDGVDYSVRLGWFDYCGPSVEDASDVAFSIVGSTPLPDITVTSPNGGEVWAADTTESITWDSYNSIGNVEVWLTDGDIRYDYIGTTKMADGQFTWPILPYVGDCPECRILVHWSAGEQTAEDLSDAPFEVAGSFSPTITVTSPSGGEVLTAGTEQAISWNSDGTNGIVDIELYRDDQFIANLGRVPASDGLFAWDICPSIGDSLNYTLRVAPGDCSTTGLTDSFGITGSMEATLTLTSPAEGATWSAGSPYLVAWTSTNLHGLVDIFLPDNIDHHWGHVAVPVSDGSFLWPIASPLSPGVYEVRIHANDCGLPPSPPYANYQDFQEIELTEPVTPQGDLDGDGDVDLLDMARLQLCLTGHGPVLLGPVCDSFDYEPDGDVDSNDYGAANSELTGPVATGNEDRWHSAIGDPERRAPK